MALQQERLVFARAPMKQLDQLLSDYPSAITTNAKIAAHKTNVDALLSAFATAHPTVASDIPTLQADIHTAIDADIPSLEATKLAIVNDTGGYNGTTFPCAQCAGAGKIQSTLDKSLVGSDPGVDSAIYVTCPLCKGDGVTAVAYGAVYDPSVIPDYDPI